jgi:mediator of RNA polymerase II transcription subunit 31
MEAPPDFVSFGPPDEFGIPTAIGFTGVHAQPEREQNRVVFSMELEFVQGLGNPFYLHNLANQGYMDDPAFINYLKYLCYWKDKEYARFILYVGSALDRPEHERTSFYRYPQALHHLDLLQHVQFRQSLKDPRIVDYLQHRQFEHWRSW